MRYRLEVFLTLNIGCHVVEAKTDVPESLQEEGPQDGVKHLCYIKLKKDPRAFEVVHQACRLLDQKEVVMHATPSDEGALVDGESDTSRACTEHGKERALSQKA